MAVEGRRCVLCPRSILRQRRHLLEENLPERLPQIAAYIRENALIQVEFNSVQGTCHRCWQTAENAVREQDLDIVHDEVREEIQIPDFVRAPNSANRCVFNDCINRERIRIPPSVRLHMLCEHQLYIPENARVCQGHLEGNNWEQLIHNCNVTHYFNAALITDMTNLLIGSQSTRFDFESVNALTNNDLYFWTGLYIDQFDLILEETPSLGQSCKDPRTHLGMYLTKLRTGESNERLTTLFKISRRSLERKLALTRECLTLDFVNRHLGVDHISREEVLRRNLALPKALFGNEENTVAIVICDGTYAYIQKSSNFLFQRQTYSLHKFQNLLKPFLMVCSDGYIIDVFGPYAATSSDAKILNEMINNEENPLHWIFNQNDAFILDRGFRDSVENLESVGYVPHVPPTKYRHETQLTTPQANKSRLITLCRWVVEAVNGKFKGRFKLLRQNYFNKALPHLFVDFKIAAALINSFYRVAVDNVHVNDIVDKINVRFDAPNMLYDYVQRKNLNRQRVAFILMDANQLRDFPRLAYDDVFMISLGSYQIDLAKSYCSEHLRNGVYIIEIYRENNVNDFAEWGLQVENVWLIRGRVQSRHVRARQYYVYILVDNNLGGPDAISHYYCTCLTGRRTVGSCAHTISIIWYLGLGRYTDFHHPAGHLNDVIVNVD